jgi:hypothetical protein
MLSLVNYPQNGRLGRDIQLSESLRGHDLQNRPPSPR